MKNPSSLISRVVFALAMTSLLSLAACEQSSKPPPNHATTPQHHNEQKVAEEEQAPSGASRWQ